jgi:hypothetical protein
MKTHYIMTALAFGLQLQTGFGQIIKWDDIKAVPTHSEKMNLLESEETTKKMLPEVSFETIIKGLGVTKFSEYPEFKVYLRANKAKEYSDLVLIQTVQGITICAERYRVDEKMGLIAENVSFFASPPTPHTKGVAFLDPHLAQKNWGFHEGEIFESREFNVNCSISFDAKRIHLYSEGMFMIFSESILHRVRSLRFPLL